MSQARYDLGHQIKATRAAAPVALMPVLLLWAFPIEVPARVAPCFAEVDVCSGVVDAGEVGWDVLAEDVDAGEVGVGDGTRGDDSEECCDLQEVG